MSERQDELPGDLVRVPDSAPASDNQPDAEAAPAQVARERKIEVLPSRPPELRFDPSRAFRQPQLAPGQGWRKLVHTGSRGRVNPGPSAWEIEREQLLEQVRTPLRGRLRLVALWGRKGGTGKTGTTLGLGYQLAEERPDRVIAADVNPDSGSLTLKVRRETAYSGWELAEAAARIRSLAEVREYTSHLGRLEVLASPPDTERAEAIGAAQFERVLSVLRQYHSLGLIDCGTGVRDNRYWLERVDQVVVVTEAAEDCAAVAVESLKTLVEIRGHGWVEGNVVVVINKCGEHPNVDYAQLAGQFAEHVRAVREVPADPALKGGGLFRWDALNERTRTAYLRLAAAVSSGFHS